MNSSGNLLTLDQHSGIPPLRMSWREMACGVSPYGMTVGTCIFFEVLMVLYVICWGIISLASRACVKEINKLKKKQLYFSPHSPRVHTVSIPERWHVGTQLSVHSMLECVDFVPQGQIFLTVMWCVSVAGESMMLTRLMERLTVLTLQLQIIPSLSLSLF